MALRGLTRRCNQNRAGILKRRSSRIAVSAVTERLPQDQFVEAVAADAQFVGYDALLQTERRQELLHVAAFHKCWRERSMATPPGPAMLAVMGRHLMKVLSPAGGWRSAPRRRCRHNRARPAS